MKKDLDIFIDVYQKEIVNEDFGTMLKNAGKSLLHKATFGLAGSSKNKSLFENLRKTLDKYGFKIGEGETDEEDFSQASKIIKSPSGKFYKIIITNDYNKDDDEILYGIKCINVITEKRVKINSNNFKLKTSWGEDEIIKAINSIIKPLDIKNDDATNDAMAEKKRLKDEFDKPKKEAEDLKLKKVKLNEIKQKIDEFEKFIDNSPAVEITLRNKCYDEIDNLREFLNQDLPNMESINLIFKALIKDIRNYKVLLQSKKTSSSKNKNK